MQHAMPERAVFDLPEPHILERVVGDADIDAYNHVNNAVYVTWCDHCAWDHSAACGLPVSKCLELDRGMAVLRTTITYLRPALHGDVVQIATWLLPAASRLGVRRRFQIRRAADGVTLARAHVDYACIELSSGRPARWPAQFHESYAALPTVVTAERDLPPL